MQLVSNCKTPLGQSAVIRAEDIKIQWNHRLPIFAKEEFLSAVSDEYGWLGGTDEAGTLRCILPYTVIRKAGLRMVRFRVQTIPCGEGLNVLEEKSFLNSVVRYFRNAHADMIVPPSNNSIFRTFPDGALAAPYGSYVIDLEQPEDILWKNISSKTRQHIRNARRSGVIIRERSNVLRAAYDLMSETFRRSKIGFMGYPAFERFVFGLGDNGKLLTAEYEGVPQSYCLFAFSTACVYAIYAGNAQQQQQGANKLLEWEAICMFRSLGVGMLDYYGARINPRKGSKQEGINLHKIRMGAKLTEGYMWKYSLRPWRASLYSVGIHLLRGGDIVDQEKPKLSDFKPAAIENGTQEESSVRCDLPDDRS